MKIAVMNFSGNVGKTTIAKYLLQPRLRDAKYFAVETINADGSDQTAMKGSQYGEIIDSLRLLGGDVVIDVGASNVEKFVELMQDYMGSHEEFDFFVVPAVQAPKQQRDTIATIDALNEIGVAPDKIRIVFNMMERGDDPARAFSGIFDLHRQDQSFTLRPKAVVTRSEIWTRLKDAKRSLADIATDTADLKGALAQAEDPYEKLRLSQEISNRGLAQGVNKQLDGVFRALFH